MRKRSESPCISVCKLLEDVCVGCGRTIVEITKWTKMTDEEKEQTVLRSNERKRHVELDKKLV